MATKIKKNSLLHFINFLFFAKNSGAKNKKRKFDQIFVFFKTFSKFFWIFLNFLRKIYFCGLILRNSKKIGQNLEFFENSSIFGWHFEFVVLLVGIWVLNFFLFFVHKKFNFFFFAKNQNAKNMPTIFLTNAVKSKDHTGWLKATNSIFDD